MEELRSVQGFMITIMCGILLWGVQREKRGSRSSCIVELKSIGTGIKEIQFLRHLMLQLGLPGVLLPTPIMNDNQGSLDWIEAGFKPTKKLSRKNLAKLGIAEAKQLVEITFHWMEGKSNPADIFTKEDNDVQHFCMLRDQISEIVISREAFWGV